MAQNLIKSGYRLWVNDVVPEAVKRLENDGACVGDTPANIASKTKTIITMLPSRFVVVPVAKLSIATGHAMQIYNCLVNCKFA